MSELDIVQGIYLFESEQTRAKQDRLRRDLARQAEEARLEQTIVQFAAEIAPINKLDADARFKVLKLCSRIDPGKIAIGDTEVFTRRQMARIIADVLLGSGADWERR